MLAAVAERPGSIVYPVGSRHLVVPARSRSRARGVFVRCVLLLLFWWALALLRLTSAAAKARGRVRGSARRTLRKRSLANLGRATW